MASTFDIPGRDEVVPRTRAGMSSNVSTSEESSRSAVSWAAIIAGALAATAVTVILLVVGTGVGISTVSPWYGAGASAATVSVSALVWLVVVQWISSGLGGFLAGRLRTKWVRLHAHEIFFRDTAHGFLAWSLASVAGASLFASATVATIGGVARGATESAAGGLSQLTQAAISNGRAQVTRWLILQILYSGRRTLPTRAMRNSRAARQPASWREASKAGKWRWRRRMRHISLKWSPRERVLPQQKPSNVWMPLPTGSTMPNRNCGKWLMRRESRSRVCLWSSRSQC